MFKINIIFLEKLDKNLFLSDQIYDSKFIEDQNYKCFLSLILINLKIRLFLNRNYLAHK